MTGLTLSQIRFRYEEAVAAYADAMLKKANAKTVADVKRFAELAEDASETAHELSVEYVAMLNDAASRAA